MEEAAELRDYLPLSFTSPREQEYVAFLWDAFETNYTHGKYQFAFLAYHMLTMSFVYFKIWQIKKMEPKYFEMSLIGFRKDVEKNLSKATSPLRLQHCQRTHHPAYSQADCLRQRQDRHLRQVGGRAQPRLPTQTATSSSELRPPWT